MAAKKDEATIENAELTPEVKEELFTAPIEIGADNGEAVKPHGQGGYDQNSGTFIR